MSRIQAYSTEDCSTCDLLAARSGKELVMGMEHEAPLLSTRERERRAQKQPVFLPARIASRQSHVTENKTYLSKAPSPRNL